MSHHASIHPLLTRLHHYLHLDFDIDTRREREAHQRVDRLSLRLQDVDEPFVYANLKLFAAILVNKGCFVNRVLVLFGRQWSRTRYRGARALCRIHNLPGRLVNDFVIVRFDLNPNALLRPFASALLVFLRHFGGF